MCEGMPAPPAFPMFNPILIPSALSDSFKMRALLEISSISSVRADLLRRSNEAL